MAPELPPNFPLPTVHTALAPYIHSPTDTQQIRQIITTHLQSLASQPRVAQAQGPAAEFDRFLDVSLSRTPSLHRQYLTSLRAHAAAKAEYNALLSSLPPPDDASDDPPTDASTDWKAAYLTVLRLRRQHSRLSVLREGIMALSSATTPRPPQGLEAAYTGRGPGDPPREVNPTAAPNTDLQATIAQHITSLQLALETRILTTHESLRRAKQRLATLPRAPAGSPPSRLGLDRVQTELLAWLEAATDPPRPPVPDLPLPPPASTPHPSSSSPDHTIRAINARYDSYLASRRQLLELLASPAAATAVPPLPADPAPAPDFRLAPAPAPDTPAVLHILGAVEHLLPLSHAQKAALAAQNAHGANMVRGRAGIAEALGADDVYAETERVVRRVNAEFARATEKAREAVEGSGRSLKAAREVAGEVGELVGVGTGKKGIPVRAEGGGERRMWEALDGGVGVIGDGI